MDFYINLIPGKSENVVHIAGRLFGNAATQLKKACEHVEGPLVIDLSELLYADDEGINAIQAVADRGSKIRGASPFVQLLMDKAP
jgi:hypothetical protein